MAILAGVLQILLFFVFWRLLHWISAKARGRAEPSPWTDVAVNVAMAVVLLIAVDNLKSAWWMMSLIGAVVGVATGQLAAGAGRKAQQAAGSPASPAASPAPRNQAVAEGDKPLESDGGRE